LGLSEMSLVAKDIGHDEIDLRGAPFLAGL